LPPKAAIPHLRAGGRGGSIILTSSTAGLKALENTAHYEEKDRTKEILQERFQALNALPIPWVEPVDILQTPSSGWPRTNPATSPA
jgi:(+)-trans-carveol dehydrogenase